MPRVNLAAMRPYLKAGYTLLPLHTWGAKSVYKGKEREDGKRPLHRDWTNRPYSSTETLNLAEDEGNNVGVRLTAEQLVVDVDPRNMPEGVDTFKKLCKSMDLDPDDYPTVVTGSGGLHVYMTKPADVPVIDSAEGYQGVEFKTRGRQVVAAGSVHPSGGMYEWDELTPGLSDAPPAPERLLSLIRRPERKSHGGSGGGEHSQEEILEMLDELDPADFGQGGDVGGVDWLRLMMACHHASNGDARQEFIDWSTRDPEYSDDEWIIGRRWDSLHTGERGAYDVTRNTLYHVLREKGKGSAIPFDPTDAANDFEEDVDLPGDEALDGVPQHERKGPLQRLNDAYCTVMLGGKFRIAREIHNPALDRKALEFSSEADFRARLRNRKVEKQTDKGPKAVPISEEWLEWGQRRDYDGVLFDPERQHKGWLNLWTGWGVEPRPGDWSTTKELVHDVLCDGQSELSEFVFNWMAHMVQKPWMPAEVAICFRGDKGTGKSTLGGLLVALSGRHGLTLTDPKHITGSFNSHLMETVFMFADEAIPPTDRASQSKLKGMLTGNTIMIEPKGIPAFPSKSCLHVMIASNSDWFVDASAEGQERRYFISEVSNKRQQDIKFFARLHKQMYEDGGLEAMLHDLLARDIKGWAPRGNIPESQALASQKLLNLSPIGKWWFSALDEAVFPSDFCTMEEEDWDLFPVRGFIEDLKNSFISWCESTRINPGGMNRDLDRVFWAEVSKMCPDMEEKRNRVPEESMVRRIGRTDRARSKEFPDLERCRGLFEEWLGSKVSWTVE